jgi:hypothetical protein
MSIGDRIRDFDLAAGRDGPRPLVGGAERKEQDGHRVAFAAPIALRVGGEESGYDRAVDAFAGLQPAELRIINAVRATAW